MDVLGTKIFRDKNSLFKRQNNKNSKCASILEDS